MIKKKKKKKKKKINFCFIFEIYVVILVDEKFYTKKKTKNYVILYLVLYYI